MIEIKKPQSPLTKEGQPFYPLTDDSQVVTQNGRRLNVTLANMDSRWAGAWIEFTDEDGNPTTEPYLHFAVDENGNPTYTGIPYAEDGEF